MPTGKPAQIMDALFARCATLAIGSPARPIAFPEPPETFVPPADGKYLEVQIFPNAPAWQGVSHGRLDQGLLQVTVVWPKNKGLIGPGEDAGAVIAHFPHGLPLFSGQTRVVISGEPWSAQPLTGDSDVRVPVTIPWTA